MRDFLVVVDMQKDFVDGSLGTLEAQAIVGNVVKKIESFQGEIFVSIAPRSFSINCSAPSTGEMTGDGFLLLEK